MGTGARRIDGVRRGPVVRFTWHEEPISCYAGETIAGAMLTYGISTLRSTAQGEARGVFCGMGACFECRVVLVGPGEGVSRTVRACVTTVTEGMAVRSHYETGPLPLNPPAEGKPRAQLDFRGRRG